MLSADRILEVVPIGLESSVILGHTVDLANPVSRENSVLISKERVLRNHRRNMLARKKVSNLGITHVDSCGIAVLEEHIPVKKTLPCSILNLLLGLVVLSGRTGGDFVDCSECVQLILEILVGNSCSCNFTYILRLPEESHQVVHRGDEVQERKRDDDGNYHTEFFAHFLKYCHMLFNI